MKAVLGGTLENSVIRRMTAEFDPERLDTRHTYYRSLQRSCGENTFSRAALILAVSEASLLPTLDWATTMLGAEAPAAEDLGWKASARGGDLIHGWNELVSLALDGGAFSGPTYKHLTAVDPVGGEEDSGETARFFAEQHLLRLMQQTSAAGNDGALLFMPRKDEDALRELSRYAAQHPEAVPGDVPDFDAPMNDPEGRSVTLLAFDPPDVASLIPARNDAAVRRYAERVAGLWGNPDPVERERQAMLAMRDVVRADDVRGWAARAFEAVGWGLKPLSWLGVPVVGAVADARDVAAAAAERERTARNWLLIRTRLQDISLKDYLTRTGNL